MLAVALAGCGALPGTATTDDVDPGPWIRTIDWPLRAPATATWGESWVSPDGGTVVLTSSGNRPRAVDARGASRWIAGGATGADLVAGPPDAASVTATPVVAVAERGEQRVVLLDLATGSVVARVDVDADVGALGWAAPGTFLVASPDGVRTLSAAGELGEVVDIEDVRGIAFDPNRGGAWVTSAKGVVEVDPVSALEISTVELPGCRHPVGVDVDPVADRGAVACQGNGLVITFSLRTGATLAVEEAPDEVAAVSFTDDGGGLVAVGAGGVATTYRVALRRLTERGTQDLGGTAPPVLVGRELLVPLDAPARLRRMVTRWN